MKKHILLITMSMSISLLFAQQSLTLEERNDGKEIPETFSAINGTKIKPKFAGGLKANGDSDPCNAVVIGSFPYCPGGFPHDNTGAAGFFTPPFGCGNMQTNEIPFKFTAVATSIDITVTTGTMGSTGPEITLVEDANNNCAAGSWTILNSSCPTFGTTVTWLNQLTIGNDYYIFIDSDGTNDAGTFSLCVDNYTYTPPAGSGIDCGSAIAISLPFTHTGTTVGKLNDWNNNCALNATGFPDIYYTYTTTGGEWVEYSLGNISPAPSTFVDVYATVSVTNGCPAFATAFAVPTPCQGLGTSATTADQNSYGSTYVINVDGNIRDIPCKTLYLETAGTYYFIVEGLEYDWFFGSVVGVDLTSFDFSVSALAQAGNDHCSGGTGLSLNVAESGNNSGCNYSFDDADPNSGQMCAMSTENTAWFSFTTGPTDTQVDFTFANVAGDVQWGVVQGSCGGPYTSAGANAANPGAAGTPQDPNVAGTGTTGIGFSAAGDPCYRDNADHTATITGLTPNTQYWLVVDGNAGTPSSFDITITGGVTLSNEFLNLTAVQDKETVKLNWFASELTSEGEYTVLRSLNGTYFEEIGKVAGKSGNDVVGYDFVDDNVNLGQTYYYQLKYTNADDYSILSQSVKVSTSRYINNLTNIHVDGNEVHFSLMSNEIRNVNVKIYDMEGKIIVDNQLDVNEGDNNLNISADLSSGSYLLFIISEDNVRLYEKFLK